MAGVRISELPAASPLAGDELLPVVQGGETRRAAASSVGGKVWRGCVRRQSSAQALTANEAVAFANMNVLRASADFAAVNDDSISAIVIPSGVSLVRARFMRDVDPGPGGSATAWVRHTDSSGAELGNYYGLAGGSPIRLHGASSPISVSAGDRFALFVVASDDVTTLVGGSGEDNDASWLEVEVIA